MKAETSIPMGTRLDTIEARIKVLEKILHSHHEIRSAGIQNNSVSYHDTEAAGEVPKTGEKT